MRKVKNNGFTLIELLAVIVILGLLMGLAIPAISKYIGETRQDTYSLHEADMKAAAANKMTQCVEKNTVGCIPQSGESRTIYLNDLIDEQYSEKLRDPADTDKFCDATKSYVVVTNSNNNVVELDYQVCLVCDGYSSSVCGEVAPDNSCKPEDDTTSPTCGDASDSTFWTNSDRVISIKCSDDGCGCTQNTYYKTFTESAKTSTIKIADKAGRETECPVNVYVDKDAPTCEIKVDSYDTVSSDGWYGGDAPVVKLTSKTDGLSGVATYGIGTSKKDHDFNKTTTYEVEPGISVIYGYVRDEAGNVGTCSVEVKYDPIVPTGNITYGYQVYPKADLTTIFAQRISLNSNFKEYGKVVGMKVYLSSNTSGIRTSIMSNSSTSISDRTIGAGVNEMYYTLPTGQYDGLILDLETQTNANKVSKLEAITEDTAGFYTNENVRVYVTSQDSFSGDVEYSFDGGQSWQKDNWKEFTTNKDLGILIKDSAGNTSDEVKKKIDNIDKLKPNDATFNENGGTYTINVGETGKEVSTKIQVSDFDATNLYSESGVRKVEYQWTTTTTKPTSWTSTSNGSTLKKTSSGGKNYLWVKTTDKAGNETVTMSNDFNVGYQVTFDCNGGTGCPADQRKVHGTALTLKSTVPTRSGYTFMGWGTTASTHDVAYAASGSYSANSPIKLYAIWKKTLTFTFNANGATLSATSKSCDLYNAETSCNITLPKITRSGFTITGFNTTASATTVKDSWTSEKTVSVGDSTTKTWYAITSKDKSFTFNANGATLSKTSASCTIQNSATTCSITLPTITRSGFTITGFNTSDSSTTAASGWTSGAKVNVDKDTALTWYAVTSKKITITFTNNGASGGATKDCTIRNSATSCSITSPAITRSGFTITGWGTSADATSSSWAVSTAKNVSSNATYYAVTSKKVTITFTNNGASGGATKDCTIRNSATSCSITSPAITRSGFTITGWGTSADATSSSWAVSIAKNVSSNATYYAVTSKKITVTFTNNGGATGGASKECTIRNSATSCSITSPAITAPTNTPTVVGWGTATNSTSSSWDVSTAKNVSSNATYYAVTKKGAVTRTLTYNGNSSTSGSTAKSECTIAETYNGTAQGTSCNVTLRSNGFAKTGFSFSGWGTSASATSTTAAGATVNLSSNKTYYAIWKSACSASNYSGCPVMYVCKADGPDSLTPRGATTVHSKINSSDKFTKAILSQTKFYVIKESGNYKYGYLEASSSDWFSTNPWYDSSGHTDGPNYGWIYYSCLNSSKSYNCHGKSPSCNG